MPTHALPHVLPWLFASLLATTWATAQNAVQTAVQTAPRPLAQLAPAESFVLLGYNPTDAPDTGLQADLEKLDFPRAGRTLEKLSELSSDPTVRELLEQYSDLFQGAEGRLERQQRRLRNQTGTGAGFARCLEASTPENLETLATPEGEYSALLSVGVSSYNPIPSVTALLRVTPEAATQLAEFQRLLVQCSERVGAEVTQLREGTTPLLVVGNAGDFPVVISRVGTLFVAGTNPEAVRGVVRRAHGSAEANLSTTPFYQQNQELLAGPGMSLALNAAALGNTLESLGSSFADAQTQPLLNKLVGSLRTLGSYAGSLRVEGRELRLSSKLNVNPEGGDAELAALLLADAPAPAPTLAPAGSVAVSSAHTEPQKVLAYLEGWAELTGQATGEPVSLQDLAQQELGINLDTALGWLGNETTSIVLEPVGTDVSTLVYGSPQVLVLTTTGRAATKAGLAELGKALLQELESQFSGAGFPKDLSAQVAQSSYRFGDAQISRLRVGPNVDLGVTFIGDTLLIGTPAAALEDVLTTAQGLRRSLADTERYQQAHLDTPQGAVSSSYTDVSQELRGYANLTRAVAQPLASAASVSFSQNAQTRTQKQIQPPTFADLLHLLELIPDTLDVLSNHTSTVTGATWTKGDVRHSETRLSLR